MRIGVNALFLVPGDVGGTEVYLRENLKEMVPASPDDTFVIFTSKDNDQSLRQDLKDCLNVEFVKLPFRSAVRPIRIIVEQTLLPLKINEQSIDVLWSPGYTAPLFCASSQAVTIHDLQYKSYPEDLTFFERITLNFLVKNACKRCDGIIAVSEFSKQEIIRFNYAPEHRITVVYEGVDTVFGEPVDFDPFRIIDLPPGTPYILCVAHTYPHKKVHVLIQAFGRLSDRIPHHLVLVGKARRGEDQVRKAMDNLPDHQKVHRVSDLQGDQLNALYQGADLFVLPSEYEGFGLPVLEALTAGTLVITSKKASLPEVGGTCAIYFDDVDAESIAGTIMEVHRKKIREKTSIIHDGKIWAKSFNRKKSAEQSVKLLHSL